MAMFAMLFPEKLADAAMAQAEHMTNVDPIPFAQRPRRIAALERPPPLVTWLIMCRVPSAQRASPHWSAKSRS